MLTALFAVGSVYYFVAVQGTVWFAAHVVAVTLTALYAICALRAERPALAGLLLGLAFLTRPPTLMLGLLFVLEAVRCSRRAGTPEPSTLREALAALELSSLARKLALFAVPVALAGGVMLAINAACFGDPLDFGHNYLQIRWRTRIEKWGLFNYHYLGRNLAVMLASLPWLTATAPFVKVSRHGLALWVTTPQLLGVLWPKRRVLVMLGFVLAALGAALPNLLYQNSGWIQFGYRFSLDYAVLLFALLALGGRPMGKGSFLLLALAIAVNAFGAITFDRIGRFYDQDATQRVIFQPD